MEHNRLGKLGRTVGLIDDLLRGKAHDRTSAAKRLGVKVAAADRQMRAIEKLPGVVIEKEGNRRLLRFDKSALHEASTTAAAIGACFGASLAPLFEGTNYEVSMREVRDRVLSQHRRRQFKDIDRKFVFLSRGGELSLPSAAGWLDDVIEALLEQQHLTIEYQDFAGGKRTCLVKPLSLLVYDHQLYVLGDEDGVGLHPFRFARICNVEAADEAFVYPTRAEYDPQQLFADSFGIWLGGQEPVEVVELRLHPRWATHAKSHRWHRKQRVQVVDDDVRVVVEVRLSPEVEAWVLGFGADAEVIRPTSLRDKIASQARALAALYERTSQLPDA